LPGSPPSPECCEAAGSTPLAYSSPEAVQTTGTVAVIRGHAGVAPLAVATGELRSDLGLRRDADKRNDRLTSEKDLRSRRQGDDPDPRSADRTRRRAFLLTLLSTRTGTPSGRSLADTEDRPPGSRLEEFLTAN
jgi:hypothetical protein